MQPKTFVLVKCNKYEFSFMAAIYCYLTMVNFVKAKILKNHFQSLDSANLASKEIKLKLKLLGIRMGKKLLLLILQELLNCCGTKQI